MLLNPKKIRCYKWDHRAGAGTGAKIRGKVEPEPKVNNFVSATLDQALAEKAEKPCGEDKTNKINVVVLFASF